ncbi:MAG: cytochrome c1 [Lysobacterales bacterium]|jgi:ubiquinol-cytochrome c reductase cytochrome c1 subunit
MNKITLRLIFGVMLLAATNLTALAAEEEGLEPSGVNLRDMASLQRGAKLFVNYCMGCHSAKFMRYNRLAEDLDMSEDLVVQNLVFSDAKIGDTMSIAMDPAQSKQWFGKTPPDLSLVGRSRGPDWLFAYLKGFYKDDKGRWNNTMLPNAAMPNVLWQLQGIQTPVYRESEDEAGYKHRVIDHFVMAAPGKESPEDFEETARDLAAFLYYVSEPAKVKRKDVGVWVLLYLVLFALLAYLLKAEYWRDVH